MSTVDELKSLRKRLEADLFAINRTLALLENGSEKKSSVDEAPMLPQIEEAGPSLADIFRDSIKGLEATFTINDVARAMQAGMPGKTLNRNSLSGLLWRASNKWGLIKVVRKGKGRGQSTYAKM